MRVKDVWTRYKPSFAIPVEQAATRSLYDGFEIDRISPGEPTLSPAESDSK